MVAVLPANPYPDPQLVEWPNGEPDEYILLHELKRQRDANQVLQAKLDSLAAENERLRRAPPSATHSRAERLEARLRERQDEVRWRRALLGVPSKHLNPAEKTVAMDLRALFRGRQIHNVVPDGPIYIEGRAKNLGVSPETYGRALKNLAAGGLITRVTKYHAATGRQRVIVQPTEMFWAPEQFSRPEARNYNYRPRPQCPDCGPTADVVEQRETHVRHVCQGCGGVIGEELLTPKPRVLKRPGAEPTDKLSVGVGGQPTSCRHIYVTTEEEDIRPDVPQSADDP